MEYPISSSYLGSIAHLISLQKTKHLASHRELHGLSPRKTLLECHFFK